MARTRKEIFTVAGQIESVKTEEGFTRHTFLPDSQRYMRDNLNRVPLKKRIWCTFFEEVAMRSQQQLAYHFVLMGYLADHCGTSKNEMHDAIMRAKFGTKKIKIGDLVIEVRKSLSNEAKMPKYDVVELIEFDLKLCGDLEIRVPSREELGYDSYK
jgi:hypothetical protein